MKSVRFFFASLCVLVAISVSAQAPILTTVSSRWQDSFVEWEVFASMDDPRMLEEGEELQEELYGEFKLRWLNVRDDWSEWDFELGGERGTIRQKWK
ncbi:MAG: hypothetical protein JNN28_16815, partial [Saprospiraceae bacterium]|nr:hypothetical protein [Saprospiraceae bacterium]